MFLFAQSDTVEDLTDVGQELGGKVLGAGQETWDQLRTQFTNLTTEFLPNAAAAILVLIVGWIIALLLAAVGRGLVKKLGRARWFTQWISIDEGRETTDISRGVGRAIFYLVMLFVLVGFFQTLGLTTITEPLTAFLNQVFEYAPRVVAASVLLFVAWFIATVLRFVVRKSLTASKLDRRLSRQAGVESDDDLPLTNTLSEATYWLTYLLFLPALLDALAVPGMLAPVRDMVTQVLGFLPNLFAAAAILGIGWFVARIVQRIATNLLQAIGADQLSERTGTATLIGNNQLSDVLGLLVYILVLVPVIIGSLNALQIDAVTGPASEMLERILGTLPGILAAVLVVGIAYVVGRVASGLATNMLAGVGFDRLPSRLGLTEKTATSGRSPSQLAGTVVMVAIMLFAIMQAMPMLGFDLLATMMADFLEFAAHVLMGLIIFGFGLYFGQLVSGIIRDSDIANAHLLATIAKVSILVLAGAMGLQQTGLGQEIVNIGFAVFAGAVAVAAAIAFGIGGRDAAKSIIEDYTKQRRRQA